MVYCHQQYYNPDHKDDKFQNYGKVPILSDNDMSCWILKFVVYACSTVKRLSFLASIIDAETLI